MLVISDYLSTCVVISVKFYCLKYELGCTPARAFIVEASTVRYRRVQVEEVTIKCHIIIVPNIGYQEVPKNPTG